VTIHVALETGFTLASLDSDFHPIEVLEVTPSAFEVNLQQQRTLANRDFVLRWQPQANEQPQGAFFSQQLGNDNYGLLMVLPPIEQQGAQVLSKEVVFVIDTSGSMHGQSMEQAKQALLLGILRLNVGDRFNVIEFNSNASSLFTSAQMASDENKAYARRFVSNLVAEGGTNIAAALGLSLPRTAPSTTDESMVRQVIFITDGSVSNESQLFDIIHAELGDSRLFTVGIGSAPNSRFMRGAARVGRGTFTYIGSISQVKQQMSELFVKLESPVLTDINIADSSGNSLTDNVDYWPNPIGDLYLGEPIIVSLRLPVDQQNLVVSGKLATSEWQMDIPVTTGGSEKGLDVLWARNKIHSLSEGARDAKQRINNEKLITQLGLDYHLVTRYTSLVAVDVTPTKPQGEQAKDSKVANHLPDGWTAHKPHGQLPQGATSARFNLLFGLLLLSMAWWLLRRKSAGVTS
jgi:Ca-activated chloride channel family protein